MNVVLAYNNCRDDWQDDGSALKYWEAEALSRQCAAVRARWPRQCAAIEQCMAELSEIEQADTGDPDVAANCFGRLMGELFVTATSGTTACARLARRWAGSSICSTR